jgi:hypothetical protein
MTKVSGAAMAEADSATAAVNRTMRFMNDSWMI